MSTQLKNEPFSSSNAEEFQNFLPQYYRSILDDFRKITSSFVRFNLLFSLLFGLELFSIIFFFSLLSSQSSIFALALGTLLLTSFTYFILLFYHQARKPEQLIALKTKLLTSCRQLLPTPPGEAQHHLSLANALSKLSTYLQGFESNFYTLPLLLKPLQGLINRFSTQCYKGDVFRMKQLLLRAAIEEHLKQIRITPTDLEVHASLASAYIALSALYKDLVKNGREKLRPYFEEKRTKAIHLAIEEFKILNYYAPNDPWVHEEMASSYQALEMPLEEIREVELLFKLRPQDKEVLYRLGALYFSQGQNGKGLKIYEELKQAHYKQAEELITSYTGLKEEI